MMAGTPTRSQELRGGAQRARKVARTAYFVRLTRPFRHDEDPDLIEGIYNDNEGERLGAAVFAAEERAGLLDTLLIIPDREVALVHAEASLDADHRVDSYEQVAALLYAPEEAPPRGVIELGDRWDAGDMVVYTFETEDDARAAQAPRPAT